MVARYPEEVVHAEVSRWMFGLPAAEHEMDLHAAPDAVGGSHPAEIGLVRTDGDQGIATPAECMGKQEIEFSGLITPESEACQIVPLAVDVDAVFVRQAVESVHRRRHK